MDKKFKSGFVSIVGMPNVGKSTLMNVLVGEKISITSKKPQTTRNKITAILNLEGYQIVFLDTPGIHTPKSKLGEYMIKSINHSLDGVDVILFLVEPRRKISKENLQIIERLKSFDSDVFLVINKIDLVNKEGLLKIIDDYNELFSFKESIPISATQKSNTQELLETIKKHLPEGPEYFPSDMITDQPEKQIVAEIIREKLLMLTHEEIPHGVAIEINSMKEREDRDIMDIDATIYTEKDSHKGMIIGKNGSKLKDIGTRARQDIEKFLDIKVNLKLWVKVKKDWRDNDFLLKNFGFDRKNI